MAHDELFPLVDEDGHVIGTAFRSECHGNPQLLHPVVHCIITNRAGGILLQLRSKDKFIQPGKWDTSVGGHVGHGESVDVALARELEEEVGLDVQAVHPRFLYQYILRTDVESELVYTYTCEAEGPFQRQPEEIDELRFWSFDEIDAALQTATLTPNFMDEYRRFRQFSDA